MSSAIIGATSVAQLEENLKAADLVLDDRTAKEAERAIAGVAPKAATRASAPKRAATGRKAARRGR